MFIRVGKVYLNPAQIVSAAWVETFPEVGSYPDSPVLVFRVITTAIQAYWPVPDLAGTSQAFTYDFTGQEAEALKAWLGASVVDVCAEQRRYEAREDRLSRRLDDINIPLEAFGQSFDLTHGV